MKIKKIFPLFIFLFLISLFSGCDKPTDKKEFYSFDEFNNAKLGVLAGSEYDKQTKELFPNATILQFDDIADLIFNLETDKVDGFLLDKAFASSINWEKEGVKTITSDKTSPVNFGFVLADNDKGNTLLPEINEFIATIKEDGTIDSLAKKWFSGSRPADSEIVDYSNLVETNGTISVAISDSDMPFSYVTNNIATGFDVELIGLFAQEYGYKLNFNSVEFLAKLSGVSTNKYDIALGSITVTDERKELYKFSDVYYESPVVMVTKGVAEKETTLQDLANKKIGVVTGSIQAIMLPKLVPNANYVEYNTYSDIITALENGKIDAFPTDESIYLAMLWEGSNVDRIDEPMMVSDYGMIFEKGGNPTLQSQINEYLAEIKENGVHAALESKWFGSSEPTEFASYDDLAGTNGTIKVAVSSASKPFVYIKNGKFAGFDIEFISGFCREYGYKVEFEDSAFAGIMSGVVSGKYDIGMSGVTITDERKESVDFSDVYHVEDIVVVVKGNKKVDDLSQFKNATLGVVTGSIYGEYTKEKFPNSVIKEFNNFADLLVALKQGKVVGAMLDKPNFNSVARTDKHLKSITVPGYSVEIGFGFQKSTSGNELQSQMNEFLVTLKEDGTIDNLIDKWYGEEEPNVSIPLDELSSNSNTLNVAIDTTRKPFVYMYEGKPVGFEIEVLYKFCKEYNYNVNISDISFASGLAGLSSQKYDLVCGGLYMTDERKESVNFSDPYMFAEVVMAKYEKSGFESFISSISNSFEKTFIREDRWKLILSGIGTTILISILSVLGGTLLGFLIFMASRSEYQWLSKITKEVAKVYSKIISGTPTLVVLMLLFYVIFTSPNISGVFVAIVGFVLTFGAYVYDNLCLSVSSVDNGQIEAAYALGYSRNQTFFRIIIPQAMRIFLPGYIGEIISLVKATSIVGYIAVNDLTKVGDIIRGNTYEAFFPLIAIALIYFAITWIMALLLEMLVKKTNPKLRKNENILKGVKR